MRANSPQVRSPNRNGLLSIVIWGALCLGGEAEEHFPDPTAGNSHLEEIRQRVAQAEKLYSDFELKFRVNVRHMDSQTPPTATHTASVIPHDQEEHVHLIRQGIRLRISRTVINRLRGTISGQYDTLTVFNGMETRSKSEFIKEQSTQIQRPQCYRYTARETTPYQSDPHLFLWSLGSINPSSFGPALRFYLNVPMSAALGDHQHFIEFHPNRALGSFLGSQYEHRVESLGQEMVDGLSCDKLAIRAVSPKSGSWTSVLVWLAESRNMLPVRMEPMSAASLRGQRRFIGRTLEFREVRPGIWFPWHCEFTITARSDSSSRSERTPSARVDLNMEYIDLSPRYDADFFELDVPTETALFPPPMRYDEILRKIEAEKIERREAARQIVKELDANPEYIRHKLIGEKFLVESQKRRFPEWTSRKQFQWGVVIALTTIWILGILWKYRTLLRKRPVADLGVKDSSSS